MARFCSQCGAPAGAGAKFCAECGARIVEASEAAPPAEPVSAEGMSRLLAALLCYLVIGVAGIFFLTREPYRHEPVIRFHAWQSIFFFCFAIAFSATMRALLHTVGLGALMWLVELGLLGAWLMLIVKTALGDKLKLPLLGDLAEQRSARS